MRIATPIGLFALAACGSSPIAESASPDAPFAMNEAIPAQAKAPRLPFSEGDVRPTLLRIGELEDNGLPFHHRKDGFTGGESIQGDFSNGMIALYSMPDGGLWKVRLVSGIGERCGRAFSDRSAIEKFITTVTPSIDAASVAEKIAPAFRERTVEQVRIGSLRYTAAGGCLQKLDVTEMGALPPEMQAD